MKTSLIITTKNEAKSILALLDSIVAQSESVDEVVIADAGSTDRTKEIVGRYAKKTPINIVELPANANRAIGRNRAVHEAKHEHILITDGGCRLHTNWVREMKKGFAYANVVAGYYASDARTDFERASAPYALVMPDKVNPDEFLPATRSMGITKSVFNKVGKFDGQYRFAEDYEFARRLQAQHIPIKFVQQAIVYWRPRQTWSGFAQMIYEHAYGDAFSRTFRPKVALIFARYFIWLVLLAFVSTSTIATLVFAATWIAYILFSIKKNFRYAPYWKSFFYLPVLQLLSDFAVMCGTIRGYIIR